jgi:hypothetical protein
VQFQGQFTVPLLGLKTKNLTLFQHTNDLASGGPACSGSGGGGSGGGGSGGTPGTTISFDYGNPPPTVAAQDDMYWFWTIATQASGQGMSGTLYVISLPDTTTCPATAAEADSASDAMPATEDDAGVPLHGYSRYSLATTAGAMVLGPQVTCAYVAGSPDATPIATAQSITTTVEPASQDGPVQWGLVSGQVTDAVTGAPIGGVPITVVTNLTADGSGVTTNGATGTITNNAGDYIIDPTAGDSWNVLFGDNVGDGPGYVVTQTACADFCGYAEQWYDNAPTYDASTPLPITAGTTIPDVSASLTPIPQT